MASKQASIHDDHQKRDGRLHRAVNANLVRLKPVSVFPISDWLDDTISPPDTCFWCALQPDDVP